MDPIVLQADEGEAIWFLDTLVTVKAASESTGSWALMEMAAAGHAPPLHAHHSEDEAFYVLEGEMAIICGDRRFNAAAGSFVLIPRGVPHTFKVEQPAKWLVLAPSGDFMSLREQGACRSWKDRLTSRSSTGLRQSTTWRYLGHRRSRN